MSDKYPPTGFHFQVEFMGDRSLSDPKELRFQEVSGLSFEVETDELREGGENRFVYRLPKRVKYPLLVLKRGYVKDSAFVDWIRAATETYFTVPVYDFKPVDMVIMLLGEESEPVAKWKVVNAYPLKWATSDFKASDNSIAVETIELAYQYFERMKP